MDRRIEEIQAAAMRHSPVWREIVELAFQCYLSAKATGSNQALDQRYLLDSGMLITGGDAMSLVLFLQDQLKDVDDVDAEDVWNDLDGICDVFPAATA